MAITIAARAAFNRRIGRKGVWPRITLVCDIEYHRHLGLRARHGGEWNTEIGFRNAPVGMQLGIDTDGIDPRARTGVNGQRINGRVPHVIRGQYWATCQIGRRRISRAAAN